MTYTKQNFVDNQTLSAEHLNHIEDGIASLDTNKADTGHAHPKLTIKTYGDGYTTISEYNGTGEFYLDLIPSSVGLLRLSSTPDILSYNGDNYNIGGSKVSLGYKNKVTGAISAAIGQENEVTDACSLAIGRWNKTAKYGTFFIGANNKEVNSNGYSYAFGESNSFGFSEGESFNGGPTSASKAYNSVAIGVYNHVGQYSTAIGDSSSAKEYSYAFGRNCQAYDYSIAIGSHAKAFSNKSVAIGVGVQANGNSTDENGNTIYGYYPSAFGYASQATAGYSLAMGYCAYARAIYAVGIQGDARGEASVALGHESDAVGKNSAALTPYSWAGGENSIAIGNSADANAKNSMALGNNTRVDGEGVTAMGHFNVATYEGCSTGTSGTALVIGNGTASDNTSNACRITFGGAVIGKAAYQSSGADYAEYFEWLDGNIDNEDRRGFFVTMEGNKIRKAKEGEYILGIVSAYPAVIGNNDMEWSGKFLLDEFGDPIKKTQKVIVKEYELNNDVCFTDEEMETLTDEERKQREMKEVEREVETEYFVLNPDFDPDKEYIHRADRPEWDTIGMLGVLAVFDDGTCQVNGFCKCNDDGVATACERGFDTYRVIERINDRLIKVVFK